MFHPDLRLLRSFVAVADERSVTRAAERLHLTQPTVSGQIKELEQALGFALFLRTTRSIAPTRQGEHLLPAVRAVLEQAEALRTTVEALQADRATSFRLGAAMYCLDFTDRLDLLDAFAEAAPTIRYTIDNRLQNAQVPDLIGERLDASFLLGVCVTADRDNGSRPVDSGIIVNEVQYPDVLERVVLRRRTIGLLVPRDSPLAALPMIPQSALAGVPIAMLSIEHGEALTAPLQAFVDRCGAIPVRIPEGNALAAERHAERQGICTFGIGWFPTLPGLVLREVEGMDSYMDLALVLGSGANPAARRFFAFARDWQAAREAAVLPPSAAAIAVPDQSRA